MAMATSKQNGPQKPPSHLAKDSSNCANRDPQKIPVVNFNESKAKLSPEKEMEDVKQEMMKFFKDCQEENENAEDKPTPEIDLGFSKIIATSEVWLKTRQFIGLPCRDDFVKKNEVVGYIRDGELLVKALWWTVEQYMRIYEIPLGTKMVGEQIACVVDSRHPDFPVDTRVVVPVGWSTYSKVNCDTMLVRKVPDLGGLSASLYLGVLGLPGLTAYFGFLGICQPKEGDIVLVNAAAGCLGGLVCQLAKTTGCAVIGFAGTKARCDWLRDIGIEIVINYRSVNAGAAVRRAAPRGVDIYFDMVGASFTNEMLECVRPMGRICMCGDVANYRRQLPEAYKPLPYRIVSIVQKRTYVYTVYSFRDNFAEAQAQLLEWIQQGKIKCPQMVYEGFDKLPEALGALHADGVVGSVVVHTTVPYVKDCIGENKFAATQTPKKFMQ